MPGAPLNMCWAGLRRQPTDSASWRRCYYCCASAGATTAAHLLTRLTHTPLCAGGFCPCLQLWHTHVRQESYVLTTSGFSKPCTAADTCCGLKDTHEMPGYVVWAITAATLNACHLPKPPPELLSDAKGLSLYQRRKHTQVGGDHPVAVLRHSLELILCWCCYSARHCAVRGRVSFW